MQTIPSNDESASFNQAEILSTSEEFIKKPKKNKIKRFQIKTLEDNSASIKKSILNIQNFTLKFKNLAASRSYHNIREKEEKRESSLINKKKTLFKGFSTFNLSKPKEVRSNVKVFLKDTCVNSKAVFDRRLLEKAIKNKKENLEKLENSIKKKSRFSLNIKNKYLRIVNNIESHKIHVLLKKYKKNDQFVNKLKANNRIENKLGGSKKNFNTFNDVLKFRNDLVRKRHVLNDVRMWDMNTRNKGICYL